MRGGGGSIRAAGVLAAAALLGGCGIRTTTVPVDAGPAPSRVSCAVPRSSTAPEPGTVLRQVYLVCSMQIAPVKRSVPVQAGVFDRLGEVTELLAQLQRSPLAAETRTGFATAVPGTLQISGPWKGDPRITLRLNQPIDELPSFALAQIVCTLTDSPDIAPAHSITLAGSTPASIPRTYTCSSDLRSRPDAADSAGTPIR